MNGSKSGFTAEAASMLVRTASTLHARVAGARLSCLIYHRVLAERDPLFPGEVTAEDFDCQLRVLKSAFHVVSPSEAVEALARGALAPGSVCLTFDDGYRDNHDVALPILMRHGVPACFFIATGFIDGGCMWNDVVIEAVRASRADNLDLQELGLGMHAIASAPAKRVAIDKLLAAMKYRSSAERSRVVHEIREIAGVPPRTNLMLDTERVMTLARCGMEIGAHTVTHPILANLPQDEARREMETSKARLEAICGRRVDLFAYPNGKLMQDYRPEHAVLARLAGFKAAFTTMRGVAQAGSDLYQIPRFTPWDKSPSRFAVRLAANAVGRRERAVHSATTALTGGLS